MLCSYLICRDGHPVNTNTASTWTLLRAFINIYEAPLHSPPTLSLKITVYFHRVQALTSQSVTDNYLFTYSNCSLFLDIPFKFVLCPTTMESSIGQRSYLFYNRRAQCVHCSFSYCWNSVFFWNPPDDKTFFVRYILH